MRVVRVLLRSASVLCLVLLFPSVKDKRRETEHKNAPLFFFILDKP